MLYYPCVVMIILSSIAEGEPLIALDRYEARLLKTRGNVSYSISQNNVTTSLNVEYACNNDNTIIKEIGSEKEEVYALNAKYGFVLEKRPGKSYVLRSAHPLSKMPGKYKHDIEIKRCYYVLNPVVISSRPISFWKVTKDFSVKKVAGALSDPIEVIYEPLEEPKYPSPRRFNCKVHMENDKAIKMINTIRYTVDNKQYSSETTTNIRYDAVSMPREVSVQLKGADGALQTRQYLYKNVSECEVPLAEFTLPFYGINEPLWLTNTTISSYDLPWFLYISIAGVICLLVASYILFHRRKQAAA